MDIKNAFLYGDLTELVLMEQPSRYVVQGESKVCMLKKIIYELKQSPWALFEKFSRVVIDGGFHRCAVDYLVFYRKTSGSCVVFAVYVDDILLTGSDATVISDTKEYLMRYFVTKDMGKLKYFLGIEFAHSRGRMCLS